LLDASMTVKVCDFGLSAVKENKAEKLQDKDAIPGTPLFLAPEVLMGQPFGASSDVYSFAITAWEIFCRTEAFSEFNNFGTFSKSSSCFCVFRLPFFFFYSSSSSSNLLLILFLIFFF
jgi:serine/threonine protein kinase